MVNVRSYGEDPEKTAEFVAAEVRGLKDGGVLSTAKHFPGHGDTPIDSHIVLPLSTSGASGFRRSNSRRFAPLSPPDSIR
jgi:beta-N-acetylhexosaminidase